MRANMLTDVIYMTHSRRVVVSFFVVDFFLGIYVDLRNSIGLYKYRKAFVFWKKVIAGREIVIYRFLNIDVRSDLYASLKLG